MNPTDDFVFSLKIYESLRQIMMKHMFDLNSGMYNFCKEFIQYQYHLLFNSKLWFIIVRIRFKLFNHRCYSEFYHCWAIFAGLMCRILREHLLTFSLNSTGCSSVTTSRNALFFTNLRGSQINCFCWFCLCSQESHLCYQFSAALLRN